eukprot:403369931
MSKVLQKIIEYKRAVIGTTVSLISGAIIFKKILKPAYAKARTEFDYGTAMIPHIDKRYKDGEDACYANKDFLVVLDGVGGWNEVGVDPGLFTKQLIKLIEGEFYRDQYQSLKDMLDNSLKQTTNKGSSTAVMLQIDPKEPRQIRTINLGDSGYAIFRFDKATYYNQGSNSINIDDLSLQYRSKEQQHGYDFPFQCGTNGDPASDAVEQVHQMQHNDIIVVGSDGLLDNMYDKDIKTCIRQYLNHEGKSAIGKDLDVKQAATCLAAKAEQMSNDVNNFSPFANAAKQAGKEHTTGGKPDDITVIVAQFKNKQRRFRKYVD